MLSALARGKPSPIWRRFVAPPDPAAGINPVLPSATARAWQVLSVACQFTASGVGGNRAPALLHLDADTNVIEVWQVAAFITAGLTFTISWQAGLGASA